MAKTLEKEEALSLRKKGESISEIAKMLGVSKSTVSYWCRNVLLTKQQIEKLHRKSLHAGIEKFIELGEQKRKARMENVINQKREGGSLVSELSPRDIFMIGLGLYWGEGYKNSNDEFGFTNSDPRMISFYIKWLRESFKISVNDLILRVSINESHKQREKEIISFWQKITKTQIKQFTKTSYIKTPSKKKFSDSKEYHGTLRVKVRRGSKYKFRILGAIESL